jgi:Fe(II)/alpha-ketoglutarate-dependent arginine beta-hydroxylase
MYKIELTPSELSECKDLVRQLAERFDTVEDELFLAQSTILAHDLPRRLRSEIHEFNYYERGRGVFVVSNFHIDQEKIGPTPGHWADRDAISPTLEEEFFLVLCGCLLGHPIAWSTQQNGYLVHDIMPIKKYENEQMGFSSTQYLAWHVEDAFHELRGDYLGMMCLRNPQQVPTVVASIADVELEERHIERLFEPEFGIKPDETHLKKNRAKRLVSAGGSSGSLESAYDVMEEQFSAPPKVAALFGNRRSPYVRVDPYFMTQPESKPHREALNALVEALEDNLQELVLQPGDVTFVDNFRMVHGRVPFRANYDGRDRWLKRINIAAELRKSRAARPSLTDRRIF